MNQDPNVVELRRRASDPDVKNADDLRRRAGAQGLEAVDYLERTGAAPELLVLKRTELSELERLRDVTGRKVGEDVLLAALVELGRHRRRRLEDLGRPAIDVAIAVLPHLIAEEVLAINSGSEDREAKLRDLVEAYNGIVAGQPRRLVAPPSVETIAPATGVPLAELDDVDAAILKVVGNLPGLEDALERADVVAARVREELTK